MRCLCSSIDVSVNQRISSVLSHHLTPSQALAPVNPRHVWESYLESTAPQTKVLSIRKYFALFIILTACLGWYLKHACLMSTWEDALVGFQGFELWVHQIELNLVTPTHSCVHVCLDNDMCFSISSFHDVHIVFVCYQGLHCPVSVNMRNSDLSE